MKPKFSVIVPTYNRADKVEACINAILGQNYPSNLYELIIVNDGSTDNTAKELERLSAGRFRYISQPNGGAASARNTGAKKAQAAWLVFTDDDVTPPKNWLGVYADTIDIFRDIDYFSGYIEASEEEIENNKYARYEAFKNGRIYGQHTSLYVQDGFKTPACTTGNMCVSKALYKKLGGFSEEFTGAAGEDAEFKLRAVKAGAKLCFVPIKATHHQEYSADSFIRQSRARGIGGEKYDQKTGQIKSTARLKLEVMLTPLLVLYFIVRYGNMDMGIMKAEEHTLANMARLELRARLAASMEHAKELEETQMGKLLIADGGNNE